MAKIAIAGASGFIGEQLAKALVSKGHAVIGLTRNANPRPAPFEWRTADLFSLDEATNALQGCEYAVYLVHSMLAGAHLTQARFEDLDLLVAENFAQAARAAGIQQIVYLSGILPSESHTLSRHLASRLEVERALASTGIPVTTLRAGLIVGAEGSSFQLLLRLVQRLPLMIAPSWTSTPAQPIDQDDVIRLLTFCIARKECFARTYDIGGPSILTYRTMLEETARALGVRRKLISIPLFTPRLSTLWVCLVTGAPRALVAPLVESLRHPMLARDSELLSLSGLKPKSFEDSLQTALTRPSRVKPRAFERVRHSHGQYHRVRSVQRFPNTKKRSAPEIAREYIHFLQRIFPNILDIRLEGSLQGTLFFRLIGVPLLILTPSSVLGSPERSVFRITGGFLCRPNSSGRLEFQTVHGGNEVLAAIHDFQPRLPWVVYKFTQALLHLAVMRLFARYLRKLDQKGV